jgi:glycosyltransferase involved in cell wall biosynthesis
MHPTVLFARSSQSNYFAAKNAGAAASRGSIVIFLDADCEPAPGCVEALVSRFDDGVAAVAGRTRYEDGSLSGSTFSVPDFSNVLTNRDGEASGFNLNNVAFRREIIVGHPLEARIRRNGGCFLLYHQLRAEGKRIVYEPAAVVSHGLDVRGFGFVRKHFDRGFDGVTVYRLDDRAVLRGTTIFRRFGGLALFALAGRRIVSDWARLTRERRQIGITLLTLPYFGAVAFGTRLIELAGALTAVVDPDRYTRANA